MSLFIDDKQVPESVRALVDELRLMLDRRKPSASNVISFDQAADRNEDGLLLEDYQALVAAVSRYFFKKGDDLSYEDYYHLKEAIKALKASVEEKSPQT